MYSTKWRKEGLWHKVATGSDDMIGVLDDLLFGAW